MAFLLHTNSNSETGNRTAGTNMTCWLDHAVEDTYHQALEENLKTDVVIVGGGIAGLTTAYCLAVSGKKVIVLEDGQIGSGETGRTTAHITTALDDRYYTMEEIFGKKNTALIAESHKMAIDYIEDIVNKENIDCEFERLNTYLFLHPNDKKENLEKEMNAMFRCGIDARLLEITPGVPSEQACLAIPNQAQFHPMKYLLGLCKAIENKGGKIFVNTHAESISSTGVFTDKGFSISAKHVVVATNAPVNDTYTMMLKQWAYRTYVIGALVKKNTIPKALWCDTGYHNSIKQTPYHYVRLTSYNNEYDLLISGGEDHIVGERSYIKEEHRYELLEKWTRARFPIESIVHHWSGEVLVPMDTIPYIGRNRFDKKNVYIITGTAGIGMTYCTIGGMLITDLINGKQNKWEKIYDPARFTLKASKPFFKMLKDDFIAILEKWFKKESSDINTVQKGEGKVIVQKGKKCGAYRDETGKLFLVSAECTHLKCIVNWNNDEKSWDCPCHGSRFTYAGKVINGPANKDLERVRV